MLLSVATFVASYDAPELVFRSQAETSYKYRIRRYEQTLGTDDPLAKKKLIYQEAFPPPDPVSVSTPVGSRKVRLALVPHPLGLITSSIDVTCHTLHSVPHVQRFVDVTHLPKMQRSAVPFVRQAE